jgi:hypothetical protein
MEEPSLSIHNVVMLAESGKVHLLARKDDVPRIGLDTTPAVRADSVGVVQVAHALPRVSHGCPRHLSPSSCCTSRTNPTQSTLDAWAEPRASTWSRDAFLVQPSGDRRDRERVLDATGNLKTVQKLLGHESIQTTGDIYTDWDIEQLAETLLEAVDDE